MEATRAVGKSLAPFWKHPPVGSPKTEGYLWAKSWYWKQTSENLSREGWILGLPSPGSFLGSGGIHTSFIDHGE